MNCNENFVRTNCNNKNDYNCQRKCNIFKLKNVYNKIINEYYNVYSIYLKYKNRKNKWYKNYADNTLRPKIIKLNTRLNIVLKNLKKNIKNTDELIGNQELNINNQNNQIYNKNNLINKQIDNINNAETNLTNKKGQIETGSLRNRYNITSIIILILLNIIVLAVIIYLIRKD
jgi:hypothetical protein